MHNNTNVRCIKFTSMYKSVKMFEIYNDNNDITVTDIRCSNMLAHRHSFDNFNSRK